MQDPRSHTCCFSGYRPEKMPFPHIRPGSRGRRSRRRSTARSNTPVSPGLSHLSLRHGSRIRYLGGEAVIRARAHHDIRLLCAVPHDHQSDRFAPSWKKRYNVCLVNSDAVRVFASNYFSGCFPCATASWSTLPPCSSATSTGRPAARRRPFTTRRAAACTSSISPLAHTISFLCSEPSRRRNGLYCRTVPSLRCRSPADL